MKLGIYKFIKEVGEEYGVKFHKYDLECDVFDEIIYVGETYDKRTDLYFKNFVNKLNPECRKINPFLLSLLHEIGHIETYTDELSDDFLEMMKNASPEEKTLAKNKMQTLLQKIQ